MKREIRRWLAGVVLVAAWAAAARGGEGALRAYPDPIPEDTNFDTVVKSQPFPFMKYPVNIIGAKVHPEEFHVSPSGQLILPSSAPDWRGLCVAALFGVQNGGDSRPTLQLPPADGVTSRLVDGYMPGIENRWTLGELQIRQLAFATCGGKFESLTGREPLVALVRYTVTNKAEAPQEVDVVLQFGEANSSMSVKAVPSPYPHKLAFELRSLRQEDGACVGCLLGKDVQASFKPIVQPKVDPAASLVLNEAEQDHRTPDYSVAVERQGDRVTVGKWQAPAGADFYIESSRVHSAPLAVDVEIVQTDKNLKLAGKLSRSGFSAEDRPANDYIAPGQHSIALPWAELAKALPEGASTLVVRCYYMADGARKPVSSWSPIVVLARAGSVPRFKNPAAANPDENRLSIGLALAAGESKTIDLAVPYFPLAGDAGRRLEAVRFDKALAAFRAYWGRELNRRAELIVPEPRIRDAYRTCLANNLTLTDRDPKTGVLMPHPDATMYEAVWAGDGSVIIQAMDRMGYHEEAESMLDYFLARQGREKPEGDVTSAKGFFSGDVDLKWMNQDGFVLWAMAEHYKLTHNERWLRRVAPQLIEGCNWIVRERARTKVTKNGERVKHYGLLPKGRPSDLYIHDNWYWTDTYSYMGLRGTADALAAIGMDTEASRLAAEADDYKACILASLDRAINHSVKPPFVPPSPYRVGPPSVDFFNENWYSISSPIYMVEAGLLDAKGEKAAALGYWLERYGLFSGLPAFMSNSIDPYYVYNQSLSQLLRGEPPKFVWTLYSLSAYAMAQGTYATIEGQNIVTGSNGETWCANRQPHMHSNSRFIDLVRIALLLEDGQTLHLMAGTPRGWLADGQHIEVRHAPSYFGEVNYTADSQLTKGQIVVSIKATPWQEPNVVLHVRPPAKCGKIRSVSVNGADWKDFDGETIRLPRLDKQTEVTCGF